MKRLFNHTKRPDRDWERDVQDGYDWDEEVEYAGEADDEEYYVGEEEYTGEADDEEYYAGEEEYTGEDGGEEYYADEEEYTGEDGGEEYYADEEEYTGEDDGEEYYADEEKYTGEDDGEEYYADEEEYTGETDGEEYYTEEEEYIGENDGEEYYAEEEEIPVDRRPARKKQNRKKKSGLLAKFLNMSTMDRIMAATGVAVLILAVVTVSVYTSARTVDGQVSEFVSVGTQLDGISMIGEKGLLAVADAQMAKIAAANAVEEEPEEQPDYKEAEYTNGGTVELELISVQKDLKIKFNNKKSGKLVSNVPFSVTITDPNGKTETWTDDDMDGIIYKKGITPGNYTVAVNALTDEKYKDYTLPAGTQKVEVKKDITYKKVDVSNEIKKESEINVAKEDTKKNETVVESTLQDTVQWVASTSTANTYVEVSKDTITNPETVVYSGRFLKMAEAIIPTVGAIETPVPTATPVPTEAPAETATPVPTEAPAETATSVPTETPAETPTQIPAVTPTPTAEATPSPVPAETPAPTQAPTAALSTGTVTVAPGTETTAQITIANFTGTSSYSATSDNAGIATAAVDVAGKITVKGVAAGDTTIKVAVTMGNAVSFIDLAVKVTAKQTVTLDKTAITTYPKAVDTVTATVSGSGTVSAASGDTNIAAVAVNGNVITITGVNAGSTTVTVTYTEGADSVNAGVTVTVKATNPREDKVTKLKDQSGQQLYVAEGDSYREAVYADYFTAARFFVKGAVKYTGWQTLDGKLYFFTADGNKVTGEQVIQGAKYNFASDGSLVVGSGTMGIDVSKWNGSIDWNAVKNSGVSYVIIRVGYRGSSQGALIEDSTFKTNIKGATAAGLKVGVYFFTQAVDEVEAVQEASMVLDRISGYKISYPVFLDVESSGGRGDKIDSATRTAVCKAFCSTIQNAGYTAGIYANKTWLTNKMDAGSLSGYKIWLAQYAASPTYTGRYDLWQYKTTGKVSGISGNVDLNLSYLGY